jgi:tripartite-type tricarboxylate transporter receptor subunit TctC
VALRIIPRIRSGQIRALAVSSAERYPLLPDIPTMAETVPGIHVESWLGLASAPGTPQSIVDRLNSEIHHAMDSPDVKAWATQSGVLPAPSTPEEFRKRVESDIQKWTDIVTRNNITI